VIHGVSLRNILFSTGVNFLVVGLVAVVSAVVAFLIHFCLQCDLPLTCFFGNNCYLLDILLTDFDAVFGLRIWL